MHLALYAHPFDLDSLADHGGLARLAGMGFREISMATSYHDGRWLMPWHRDGRVRFLEDGTVHFRPSGAYGQLQPQPSTSVPATGPSPLERLCGEAPRSGLGVRAWTVFTHNSRLGVRHPELCVENAFGDRYTYALCPAQPAVRDYVLHLVRDLARHPGLSAIEFEALGWLGWKHSSHHDKASFTPRGLLEHSLSLCFCDVCTTNIAAAGGDPERTRAFVRRFVQASIEHADAMAPPAVVERIDAAARQMEHPETAAAENALAAPHAARARVIAELGRAVRSAMPAALQCAVQVHPTAWFTGSQLPVPQARGLPVDEYVVTAYGESLPAIEQLLRGETMFLIDGPSHRKRLSIWPKAPQFTGDDDLRKLGALAVAHGVGTIAVYHLGLLPWRTLDRVARVLSA